MKQCLTLLSVLALGGCAATAELNRDFLKAGPIRTGTVLVSVTKTGQHGHILSGSVRFRCGTVEGTLPDHDNLGRYIDGERLAIPISPKLQVTAARPMGKIHVVELPAGPCEFFGYGASASNGYVTTSVGTKRPFSIKFEVTEAQINYIGNFNADFEGNGVRYSFNDTQERDLAALKRINPDLINKPVVSSVAVVNGW